MSGRKMDRHRAMAVLNFNYPPLTLDTDPEWVEFMVDMLTEDGTVQVIKVHFEPTERDAEWYEGHDY